MPDFQIDDPGNLADFMDVSVFREHICGPALQIDVFPFTGIRLLAVRVDHCAIEDRNPIHGFLDSDLSPKTGTTREHLARGQSEAFHERT